MYGKRAFESFCAILQLYTHSHCRAVPAAAAVMPSLIHDNNMCLCLRGFVRSVGVRVSVVSLQTSTYIA